MKIVVLVKHTPEPTAVWHFADDLTLDRDNAGGRLSELDEYAVEQALRLGESGLAVDVSYLTMGPPHAVDALRKALSMGGERGFHVVDDALHGADARATSLVLAAALQRIGFDLVLTGMASTDGEMSVIAPMVAARIGVPVLTNASGLSIEDGSVNVSRETDDTIEQLRAPLPAVVSVTDRSGDARYPNFRAIIAGKKKPVTTWCLADLGIAPEVVGPATVVRAVRRRPPRAAGTVIVDDGDAAAQVADFLAANNLL